MRAPSASPSLPARLGVVLAALTLSACETTPRCAIDADCDVASLCAPSGVCLARCQAAAECGAGERCGAASACVAQGGCAVAADCGAGELCRPGGVCTPATVREGDDAEAKTCGGQKFEAQATEANVLIVLDHSGSMMEQLPTGQSKWQVAASAVRQLTAQNAGRVRFGLQMFSFNAQQCMPGQVLVPVAGDSVTAISNALPSLADGRMTPIGGALQAAARSGALDDATRANFVLLLTDGMENCGGAPVAEVEALFARGVRTWAVGFGDAVDPQMLSQLAVRGGTARATAPRYFQADDPSSLQQALGAIAQGALGCDFTLSQVPPNPANLFVAVDGAFIPRDATRTAGWDYLAQGNRVTLYGPACDLVSQRPGAKVSVVYGCPDDALVETGPGGTLDAGVGSWPVDGGFPEIN